MFRSFHIFQNKNPSTPVFTITGISDNFIQPVRDRTLKRRTTSNTDTDQTDRNCLNGNKTDKDMEKLADSD